MKSNKTRNSIAAIALSAAALVGLVSYEGYRETAYEPMPGDRLTVGFGSTSGVQPGDKTDPVTALRRALSDIEQFSTAIRGCVTVPLHQYEYDAYVSLAYNIGPSAFCSSTLVRLLNQGQYEEACKQILLWDKYRGSALRGLTARRRSEYKTCIGDGV